MAVDRFENESKIWPISTEIKVNWGDMDALGHVNHSVYARWMETVRMIYFSEVGMMDLYDDSNVGPILARMEIDYELPIVFPDVVTVSTSVSRIGNSSFDMKYKIESLSNNGKSAATGSVVCVVLDYSSGMPHKIPPKLRESIVRLEGDFDYKDH
ncbi:MAG TPA: acyl-CoA thioesterase [Candidatus Poseidoniales archaeon]|nr:MAG TPA: acyl-CoA thioesterase [Candidatus Poseidoniales archaeon]